MFDAIWKMHDGRSPVVHYVSTRWYDVDYGNGDVRQVEEEVTLCRQQTTTGWHDQTNDVVVTCLSCLHEAHLDSIHTDRLQALIEQVYG